MKKQLRLLPIYISGFITLVTSTSKGYLPKIKSESKNLNSQIWYPLNEFRSLVESDPVVFNQLLKEIEQKYQTSIDFMIHEEMGLIELNCFDCDIKKVDSEIMLLAENSTVGGGPASDSGAGSSTSREK